MLLPESALPTLVAVFMFVYVTLALARLTLMAKNWHRAEAQQRKSDELQRRYEAQHVRAEANTERWSKLLDRAEALVSKLESRSS